MSSDNFNFSIDALPVSAPAKPSSLDTSANHSDSAQSGFRDVLSGSMDETRQARRTDRRDEAPSSTREAAAQKPSTDDRSNDPARQRAEINADTKRAEAQNASADEQISTEPADPTEAETDTGQKPTALPQAAEGAPPAEFVAALMATQTTTAAVDSESAASSFETTTITVQSPPQGLVTALAATGNGSANSQLINNQQADGVPGLESAANETITVDQPANAAAVDGQPVEAVQPAIENPAASGVATTTPASYTVSSTPTEGRPTPVSPPTTEPQVSTGQNAENVVPETNEPPVAPKNSPQQPTETSKTAQQQSVVEYTNGLATADEGTDPQPTPPPTTTAGSSAKNSETTDTVSSDKAGPQQPLDTTLDGQQSQSGSSDDQSQQQSSNSAPFADSLTKTSEAASLQSPLVPADDSATGQESTEPVLGGPAPISQQSDVSRTVGTTATTTVETAVDVQRPDFAMRVANAVRTSADNRQEVTMRLTPPELGALRIQVAVEQGKVSARIDAQSSAAQKILLDSLPQLKEALVQNGASVERIEVMLADNSPNDQGGALGQGFTEQGEPGNAPRDQSTYGDDGRGLAEAEETLETAAPAAPGITRNRGMLELDITI
ncbi:Flagellar hook-length control protein FliK [Symmachiella macrocystis]|uniref:Flagellar hook-length control protein FliK n=1 Tax=Symmachiella macrocystis TaxID=2527985 RepID=A0A5C6BPL4_9PLAN|nr:flagellar hook-length control protein FliK [Symmachiella macrocystis]TWU12949.1 Flagellar hook-length control protein FliK [Symmachiella macrocystis]